MSYECSATLVYGCTVDLKLSDLDTLVWGLTNGASFETERIGNMLSGRGDTVFFVVDTVTTAHGCGARLIPRPETAHGSRELLEAALAAMGIKEHGKIGWILGASYG